MFGFTAIGGTVGFRAAALDALQANVMTADNDLNITYMNKSLVGLLREAQRELKQEMPHFAVDRLIGSNIDIFHKQPQYQRAMLATLNAPHHASIRVGSRIFDLVVIPLENGSKRMGFVVEWADAKARLLNVDYSAQIAAIGRSQAVVEFTGDGTILTANDLFLSMAGYALAELKGKNQSILIDPAFYASAEYRAGMQKLARGEYHAGELKRVGKTGAEIWTQSFCTPIFDRDGKLAKLVEFSTDVTRRVQSVSDIGLALTALAEGRLERRVERALTPELDQLRLDLNRAFDTLQGTMDRVRESSHAIKGGSEGIRVSSDDLARRTEQQAASLEQTSAAMDAITATVKKTSDSAVHARSVVAATKADAEHSGTVVDQAIEAMSAIEGSSQQVSQIIGVIDEIAFQTNLLALNAGVEAARAGEAGRGFAVVASEVRALAQRSAEAAKEIKALISTSSQQVSAGVDLVNETDSALKRIVTQVAEFNAVVADIATNTQEQSAALQEVNTAVQQMDQLTQQTASMVQETTAASRALANEAEVLAGLMSQFEGAAQAAPHPNRPVAALKTVGRRGAVRKPAANADADWQEF